MTLTGACARTSPCPWGQLAWDQTTRRKFLLSSTKRAIHKLTLKYLQTEQLQAHDHHLLEPSKLLQLHYLLLSPSTLWSLPTHARSRARQPSPTSATRTTSPDNFHARATLPKPLPLPHELGSAHPFLLLVQSRGAALVRHTHGSPFPAATAAARASRRQVDGPFWCQHSRLV